MADAAYTEGIGDHLTPSPPGALGVGAPAGRQEQDISLVVENLIVILMTFNIGLSSS